MEFKKCFLNGVFIDGYLINIDGILKNEKTGRTTEGYKNKNGYFHYTIKKKNYQKHRLIYNSFNIDINLINLQIDHIDNDRGNNNINNLRVATARQNAYNRKTPLNNKLNNKNISICKKHNKIYYRVCIICREKNIIIDTAFKKLEDAEAYKAEKIKLLFGEFSRLN